MDENATACVREEGTDLHFLVFELGEALGEVCH